MSMYIYIYIHIHTYIHIYIYIVLYENSDDVQAMYGGKWCGWLEDTTLHPAAMMEPNSSSNYQYY